MLLPQLLIQHPEAVVEIVRRTPVWVGLLLVALIVLGVSSVRSRDVSIGRLVLLPLVMIGLAAWGVQSAFGAGGHLAELLGLWAACGALLLAFGTRLAPPAGARFDAATRRVHLPGSWVPLLLILMVFLMKYGIGVQLAIEPALAQSSGFALAVTALYGLLSGLFAARALRVLRLVRPTQAVVCA